MAIKHIAPTAIIPADTAPRAMIPSANTPKDNNPNDSKPKDNSTNEKKPIAFPFVMKRGKPTKGSHIIQQTRNIIL